MRLDTGLVSTHAYSINNVVQVKLIILKSINPEKKNNFYVLLVQEFNIFCSPESEESILKYHQRCLVGKSL